jgi:hypothetical protein
MSILHSHEIGTRTAPRVDRAILIHITVAATQRWGRRWLLRPETVKENWMAHHSEDVMSDLNFFLGDEDLTWFHSNHTYSSRATLLEIYSHVGTNYTDCWCIANVCVLVCDLHWFQKVDSWDNMEKFWQQCIFSNPIVTQKSLFHAEWEPSFSS